MTCKEFDELLPVLVEGELSPARLEEFELHRSSCQSCRIHSETYLTAISLVRRAYAADFSVGRIADTTQDAHAADDALTSRRILDNLTRMGIVGDEDALYFG